jgi:hypothetical protein
MSVIAQRLVPSFMQISVVSVTPLSHFRELMTPITSRERHRSSSDFFSSP